jgi:hypothetical protein
MTGEGMRIIVLPAAAVRVPEVNFSIGSTL